MAFDFNNKTTLPRVDEEDRGKRLITKQIFVQHCRINGFWMFALSQQTDDERELIKKEQVWPTYHLTTVSTLYALVFALVFTFRGVYLQNYCYLFSVNSLLNKLLKFIHIPKNNTPANNKPKTPRRMRRQI